MTQSGRLLSLNHCIYTSIISLSLFHAGEMKSQISEGGAPASFNYQSMLKSEQPIVQIPVDFSVEDLIAVDEWRVSQGAPLAVSTLIDTDLNIDNSGKWITLPEGEKIWQLHLQAKGAIALMLYYDVFYIPEGGKLFIYNADKKHLLGAYTSHTNPEGKMFATEFVAGDDLTIEYEPPLSGEKAQIVISQVGYGYNHLSVSGSLRGTGPGTSSSCMVNINCEEGEEWQNEKSGVCRMVEKIGNAGYLCSGSLINNTAKDMKPYILSVFHCTEDQDNGQIASTEDLKQWIFYFHFEQIGCENSSLVVDHKTMVGCNRIVSIPIDGGSDGLLLLLNEKIPQDYNVYFNGWDRSELAASSGVSIHHPSGDYMKISTFGNRPVETRTWNTTGAHNAHWNVIFDKTVNGHAITEGGSSGSPLFNENKQIVGTLSGGNSTCRLTNGNNLYGKLSFHWNQYSQADTARMDIWLDPLNTGTTTLAGLSQTGEEGSLINYKSPTEVTTEVILSNNIIVRWNAPLYMQTSDFPVVTGYNIYKNKAKQATVAASTLQFTDRNVASGIHNYSVSALYDSKESKATPAVAEVKVSSESILADEDININPTIFKDQIHIINYQQIKYIEIYSTDGKMIRKINSPAEWIDAGSIPLGVYFFKLVTDKAVKTIRAIKQ